MHKVYNGKHTHGLGCSIRFLCFGWHLVTIMSHVRPSCWCSRVWRRIWFGQSGSHSVRLRRWYGQRYRGCSIKVMNIVIVLYFGWNLLLEHFRVKVNTRSNGCCIVGNALRYWPISNSGPTLTSANIVNLKTFQKIFDFIFEAEFILHYYLSSNKFVN